MSYDNQPGQPAASADARLVADSINSGWLGRGFKLGIGFFLAGLVVWLIPMILLASCVGTIAAVGAASLGGWADHWEHWDDDEHRGEPVAVQPATSADAAAAQAAANTAAADAQAAGAADPAAVAR